MNLSDTLEDRSQTEEVISGSEPNLGLIPDEYRKTADDKLRRSEAYLSEAQRF